MNLLKALILVLVTASVSAYANCPDVPKDFISEGPVGVPEEGASEDENVVVHYRTDPVQTAVGELFVMNILVCAGDEPWSGSLGVDASMPAHGHGMNYEPKVSANNAGHFFAQGFLFHMPGRWRFEFSLGSEAGTRHVYSFVDI